MNATAEPDFSPVAAHPDTAAVHAGMQAGDWLTVRSCLDRVPRTARIDLVQAGAQAPGAEKLLRARLEADPRDALAATMLAHLLIETGWEIRGGGWASTVGSVQFEAFRSYLCQAEQLLISVCADDPDFDAAWCERIITARGLELGQAEARRRYDQLDRRCPHHTQAQMQLLQQLCPKWGGSLDAMHGFASACSQAAPTGTPNHAIVVDAHLEHWLGLKKRDDLSYFKSKAVHEEIRAAGDRSVRHPFFERGIGSVRALSMFALGYSLIEDWAGAKHCFTALGPYADRWGWQYLADGAEKSFLKYRATAMRRG
jgi:hypothetical protein